MEHLSTKRSQLDMGTERQDRNENKGEGKNTRNKGDRKKKMRRFPSADRPLRVIQDGGRGHVRRPSSGKKNERRKK